MEQKASLPTSSTRQIHVSLSPQFIAVWQQLGGGAWLRRELFKRLIERQSARHQAVIRKLVDEQGFRIDQALDYLDAVPDAIVLGGRVVSEAVARSKGWIPAQSGEQAP